MTLSIGQNYNIHVWKRSLASLQQKPNVKNILRSQEVRLQIKKYINNAIKNSGTQLNRKFSQEESQMAQRHLKKYLTLVKFKSKWHENYSSHQSEWKTDEVKGQHLSIAARISNM